MCCASVAMYEENTSQVSYIKTCMDSAVADANIGMWIDNFYTTIECDRDNNWARSSAVSGVGISVASTAALLALNLLY